MGVRVYTTFGNESKQKLPLFFASLSWLACVSNQLWKLWHVASLFLANSQEWKAKHVNQELGILVSLVLRSLIFSLYIYICACNAHGSSDSIRTWRKAVRPLQCKGRSAFLHVQIVIFVYLGRNIHISA